ncbi:MAG: Fur family transcriptional regulator [Candidatus Latescibacterota bacterium]
MDEKSVFETFLRSEGLRVTSERELVLKEAFSIHEHFEVEDLVFSLRQQGHRVSKATVYRTLSLLVQCSLLREVIFGERHSHYEHILGHKHHDHLICQNCGRIIEFADGTIEQLQKNVCELYRFEPIRHRLEITGCCEECATDRTQLEPKDQSPAT